eukprot:scaffold3287_cov181-Amphora_coffeaeformis.AAC.6
MMVTTTTTTTRMAETPPPLHVRPNIRPRNFVQYPITNSESAQIEQHLQARYAHLQRTTTTTTTNATIPRIALCHPTIHYNEESSLQTWDNMLDPFFALISYYRLLGVSRIFAWYEPNVVHATRWNELVNTTSDYVTLTPLLLLQQQQQPHRGDTYHGQKAVEKACMGQYAASYDWAMKQDADEFFWWSQKGNLIDFALAYDNYTFISKGDSVCPTWLGRCKIFARPKHHPQVSVHGDWGPVGRSPAAIHLDTSVARLNEFMNLHVREKRLNVTLHDLDTKSIWVSSPEEGGMWGDMNSYKWAEDGKRWRRVCIGRHSARDR